MNNENKLIGKIVSITGGYYSGEWGRVIAFDGEYYYIAIADDRTAMPIFDRSEFRVCKNQF